MDGANYSPEEFERLTREWKWDVPEYYNFAWDTVDRWAQDKTKLALITVYHDGRRSKRMTFWEMMATSNQMANILRKRGIKKGNRVFLMLPRSEEWYIAMLGLCKIGAVAMPTPTLSTAHDIEYRINRAEAVMCITDREGAEKVDQVKDNLPTLKHKILTNDEKKGWEFGEELIKKASMHLTRNDVEPTKSTDPLLIYFTSGTTGNPKMVMHTHAYPIGHTVTARFAQDLKQTDIIWAIADTGWAKTAWGKLFGQWIIGACIMQWQMRGRFYPEVVLNIIQKYGVSVFCAPPTAYRMMVTNCNLAEWDFSQLRHCLSAGEPLNPEVINVWKKHTNRDIYDYYGQTETVALVANTKFYPIRQGSMGKPTIGHHVEILDDDGNPVPQGEEGHIAVKVKPEHPPGIFHGYWKDDDKTAEVFIGDWYFTGDKAYQDGDGYFWFVGRADDVIKASGYRIGPFEVESALQEHGAVAESAVIGVPDEVRGEVVKAFIILAPGYEGSEELKKELQDFVKNLTAPYKYPRRIDFVTELPKTISGKIKRKELRKMELEKSK